MFSPEEDREARELLDLGMAAFTGYDPEGQYGWMGPWGKSPLINLGIMPKSSLSLSMFDFQGIEFPYIPEEPFPLPPSPPLPKPETEIPWGVKIPIPSWSVTKIEAFAKQVFIEWWEEVDFLVREYHNRQKQTVDRIKEIESEIENAQRSGDKVKEEELLESKKDLEDNLKSYRSQLYTWEYLDTEIDIIFHHEAVLESVNADEYYFLTHDDNGKPLNQDEIADKIDVFEKSLRQMGDNKLLSEITQKENTLLHDFKSCLVYPKRILSSLTSENAFGMPEWYDYYSRRYWRQFGRKPW